MWSVRSETAWTYGPLSVVADAPSQLAGTSDSVAVAGSARGLTSKWRIWAAERTRLTRRISFPVRASTIAS